MSFFVCQSAVFCVNAQRTPMVGMSKLGEHPGSARVVVGLLRGAQKVQHQPGEEAQGWQQPSFCFLDGVPLPLPTPTITVCKNWGRTEIIGTTFLGKIARSATWYFLFWYYYISFFKSTVLATWRSEDCQCWVSLSFPACLQLYVEQKTLGELISLHGHYHGVLLLMAKEFATSC